KELIDNEQFAEYIPPQTTSLVTKNWFKEETALPTKLLDVNGELITQLAGGEKREIISINNLPQHLIDALITREDRIFYEHGGFSTKALFRAVAGQVLHMKLGGGSTLTQQIAGTLYCDRSDMSITRKIKELWYAIQMERRYTKSQILELYLNKIYFGGGMYGVDAACKYYFGHDTTHITPAEAAILVIQLSNPSYYNPFDYPNRAMDRQKYVLSSMIELGYITQEEADNSYGDYWANFDYTRTGSNFAYNADDKAPWFSDYVQQELQDNYIFGTDNIYTSGFTVNTSLNLKNQYAAQSTMDIYIKYANKVYQDSKKSNSNQAFKIYTPFTELLALTFNINEIKITEQQNENLSKSTYTKNINPLIDVMSLVCGLDELKISVVNQSNIKAKADATKTLVEGTMVALDNSNGYITALVGGSKFEKGSNEFNRAMRAKIQPGSSFKPLYYSAAIDSRNFTPTTIISDTPVVFNYDDGTQYIPLNFRGEFSGDVQLWYALAHSMNIPSLKILDGIGFEAAIDRAVALLGIPENEVKSRGFERVYPLGLGVCSVRPVELVRAYSVFANGGKEVTPIAIRSVEDRNGNVQITPESDIRKAQAAKGAKSQVITPQTAFVMTKLMENTVKSGTLAGPTDSGNIFAQKTDKGRTYVIPAAGKTGTTQNWADAWATCFTPYYTSTFWFGFDKRGETLGTRLTGSTLSGYAMARFMKKIHEGLPYKDFTKPVTGVVEVTVCSQSGGILTPECGDHKTTQWFLEGTEPTQVCSVHSGSGANLKSLALYRLEREFYKSGYDWTKEITDWEPLTYTLDGVSYGGDGFSGSRTNSSRFIIEEDEFGVAQDFNPFMD
ncbi:MAG: PBP1A family penicillin-binding protein, partial [Treponema sp.]|nr:PBP1A family penicillin-binding protein [Treponema sp.]